jgi:hypothetical protein
LNDPCNASGSTESVFSLMTKRDTPHAARGHSGDKRPKKEKRVPAENPETLSISWCPLRDSNTGHTD